MRRFFAYIRVSTAKQGEQGVSLQEQRGAIERYASRNGIEIIQWFEERETAATRGRPIFSQMLKLIRQGKADGLVIHKIDRSARNLRDWADLGELIRPRSRGPVCQRRRRSELPGRETLRRYSSG